MSNRVIDFIHLIDEKLVSNLATVVSEAVGRLAPGLAAISVLILTLWLTYQALLAVSGTKPMAFSPLLVDFFWKVLIISIAGSAPLYVEWISTPVISTINGLATAASGSSGEFTFIADRIFEATKIFIKEAKDYGWTSVGPMIILVVKAVIYFVALVGLTLVSFFYITLNKFIFYMCLSVGPIFIFAFAFEKTKGWATGWLNTTISYGFAFVFIKLILSVLLTIASTSLTDLDADLENFIDTAIEASMYILFGVIVYKTGDIAGQFFGTGNIADQVGQKVQSALKSRKSDNQQKDIAKELKQLNNNNLTEQKD
jgi:hypothetical protein